MDGRKPDSETLSDDAIPVVEASRQVTFMELVDLFTEVMGKVPADFHDSVNNELLQGYKPELKTWTISRIYEYLSGSDIFKTHITFTQACFDEVYTRIRSRNSSPRDDVE
jgi:hypothetical protein